AEHREPVGQQLGERRAHARRVEELAHRGRLTTGEDQRVERAELGGSAHLHRLDAQRVEHLTMLAKRPPEGENAHPHLAASRSSSSQPRSASLTSSVSISSPRIASPSPRDTLATMVASAWCVVASTMAFAIVGGSALLKIPLPTNTACAPSCITSAASAG